MRRGDEREVAGEEEGDTGGTAPRRDRALALECVWRGVARHYQDPPLCWLQSMKTRKPAQILVVLLSAALAFL